MAFLDDEPPSSVASKTVVVLEALYSIHRHTLILRLSTHIHCIFLHVEFQDGFAISFLRTEASMLPKVRKVSKKVKF